MDPAHSPYLGNTLRELERRVTSLEQLRQYRPTAVSVLPTNGTPRDQGFWSEDTTTYLDMFRADVYCTAPVLDYDLQTLMSYGTSITSIEWRIEVTDLYDASSTVVASGSDTVTGTQSSGYVDLFDTIGEQLFNRFIRLDLEIKRTGGSGDAAVRWTRPPLLRPRAL